MKMATAEWPDDWPEDWPSESPSKREEEEEEEEGRYSLTQDTESRTPESNEVPKHAGIPELENIPNVDIDSLPRSIASFRYSSACVRAPMCVWGEGGG